MTRIKTEDVVELVRVLRVRSWKTRLLVDQKHFEQAADTIERLREENARVTEALAICQEHNRKMLRARFEAARAPRKRRAALTPSVDETS